MSKPDGSNRTNFRLINHFHIRSEFSLIEREKSVVFMVLFSVYSSETIFEVVIMTTPADTHTHTGNTKVYKYAGNRSCVHNLFSRSAQSH